MSEGVYGQHESNGVNFYNLLKLILYQLNLIGNIKWFSGLYLSNGS